MKATDGEATWSEVSDPLEQNSKVDYVRFNVTFNGPLEITNVQVMPAMQNSVRVQLGTVNQNRGPRSTKDQSGAGGTASLKQWFDTVTLFCDGYRINGALPTKVGGYIYQGYNETCLKDKATGGYCNDIIANFTRVQRAEDMPDSELCSFCYVKKMKMMQASSYSVYNAYYKDVLELIQRRCDTTGSVDFRPPLISRPPTPPPFCVSGNTYVTGSSDSCDSIALKFNVSSAALFSGNQDLIGNCNQIAADTELCLPLSCSSTYTLQPNDTCDLVELAARLELGALRKYNPWINRFCTNLQPRSFYHGNILYLGPQAGTFAPTATIPGATDPVPTGHWGYTYYVVPPPENATVATNTTMTCGKWYAVTSEDKTCAKICMYQSIPSKLFLEANPSLSGSDCSVGLVVGLAYCVGPTLELDFLTGGEPPRTTGMPDVWPVTPSPTG